MTTSPPLRVLPSALHCNFSMAPLPVSPWAQPSLTGELDSAQALEAGDPAAMDTGLDLDPGSASAWLRILGKFATFLSLCSL